MKSITLGMSGLQVSRIALGTWQIGGDWGSFDEREAIATIQHARELGINFFDTAQAYGFGASERLLGDALRTDLDDHREQVVIATKGGLRSSGGGVVRDSSPQWLRNGVESSLRELGVEYIDLYQVHWPDPAVPLDQTADALEQLVQEGKIRHVGVSNFAIAEIERFAAVRPVETIQPPYHLFSREIERDLLPYAADRDIGVLVYGPLAHGLLSGAYDEQTTFPADDWRARSPIFRGEALKGNLAIVGRLERFAAERGMQVGQLAVAWTLANPAVHVAIVGARQAAHIDAAASSVAIRFSDDELAEIDAIMRGAVSAAGPSPETV